MPLLDLIQASFGAGELSRSIYSRIDLEKYKTGLKTARNFIIHPQGGASNRCGFEYIGATKYSGTMSVAQEFIFNQTQAYVLEFGNLYIRFYTDGAAITSSGSPYEVTTPYLAADLNQLKFEASADVIWITHPNYQTRTLTRYGNAMWVLATISPTDGPFMPDNIDISTSLSVAAVTGTTTLSLGTVTTVDSTITALMHFDGSNGATSTTEETGRLVTFYGDAQISPAQSVFGGSSILFDGVGDDITLPVSAGWNFGSGNFTIKARIRPISVTSGVIIGQWDTAASAWQIEIINGKIVFTKFNGGTQTVTFNSTLSVNNWYDVMLINNSTVIKCAINGTFESSTLGLTTAMPNVAADLSIGARNIAGVIDSGYNGYVDELLIKKGSALHTTNFTLETSAFSYTTTSSTGSFLFSPYHVGALFKLTHYIEGQTVSQAFTGTGTSSSIKCFTTWRLITHGTWTGKIKVEKSNDGGTTWTVIRAFSSANDFNADTSGTEDIETNTIPFLVRINAYSFSSGTCNVDLTTDAFYQEGIVRATAFLSTTSMTVFVLQTVGLTTNTTDWAEGSWSDFRGYPSVARFYQDRLCFAGTTSEPQTIWMTETGNYNSFIRHSTLLDTDGITINLPSRQINQINGLVAFKQLLVFTSSAIWSVGPATGTVVTPTTIKTDIEEYSGSSNITPSVIGTEAIYNQTGAEIMRNIGYQLEIDGFSGSEANILAYHLFQGYTITRMAFQKNPNSILWCLRSDGILLALTYNAEQKVVAWTHHDTDGTIESICVIPGDNSDELWLTVSRDNGRYIERMQGRKQFDLTDHIFMDSYITQLNSTLVISGLTNLANQTVSILADGVVLDSKAVSASGTLGMSATHTITYLGLPYNSDLETLNVEVPLKNGTMQGSKVKIGNVTFRLINSRGGYVGPNENSLYEAFTYDDLNRANQLENGTTLGVTSNFSGDIRVLLNDEYSQGGRMFYRQVQPLPISVGAVVPEVAPGGLSS